MRKPILWLCCLAMQGSCTAQDRSENPPVSPAAGSPGTTGIQWLRFEEAVILHEKEPRKLIIDVYTHWCGWCKKMDKTTFVDSAVARAINESFYAVKLDAERKDTVRFRDKIFVYKPEYKSHELAIALLNGQMSYPTYVFLDETFAMISPVPGYKTRDEMLPLLRYFSTNAYKSKSWEEFRAGNGSTE